jgi:hypothetical protein
MRCTPAQGSSPPAMLLAVPSLSKKAKLEA